MLLREGSMRESFQNKSLEKRPVQVVSLIALDLERIAIYFRSQLPKRTIQHKALRIAAEHVLVVSNKD